MKNTNYLLTLVIIIFTITLTKAQPTLEWVKTIGSTFNDYSYDVAVDGLGNVYTTGAFSGTADFDPGAGTFNLTSVGGIDIFVQKLDAFGNFVWAKAMGNTNSDYGKSITVDASGNVYTTGSFSGTVDFDPGTGTFNLTSVGSNEIYVQKLDLNGNFVWAKAMGSTSSDIGESIVLDASGNVYTTGYFSGTVDFDPGAGTFNLTSVGNQDIYVHKLDVNGNFVWAKAIGSTNTDSGRSIAVDSSGNVYTTGYFSGTVDFDPGTGTFNLSSVGSNDIYVHKLDVNGNFVWAKAMGNTNSDYGQSIAVGSSGNVYTTGYFNGTVDFDPGTGTFNLTSVGNNDIYVHKLDVNGNFVWAKAMGSTNHDYALSIALDISDNVYTTGYFNGTVDFDPGTGTFNLTSVGSVDIYIHKLDVNGNFVWAKAMGDTNNDFGQSIALDASRNVYTTGSFNGTVDFDPEAGTFNLTSVGSLDIFVHKMNQCSNTTSTINPSACTSYTSPSGNYTWTTSNTYTDTIQNAGGCDSIITINLTITGPSNGTDEITACNSYTWIDNNTYTTSNNTATHTITNGAANGCDSIVTLNLTINNTATGTDVITACDSYTWIDNNTYTTSNNTATHTIVNGAANGCDSIVTLNLTINNTATGTDVITACNSYTWIDNINYTASNNTATHTITGGAANGCDSIVTLNLTINTIDNSTSTQGNDSIMANATGATYQWLDCNNNYSIISGATNQLFVASANGSYAVEVTQNGCTDTSACVNVTGVGIDDRSIENTITIFPNPSNGLFTIKTLDHENQTINLLVINTLGKVIDEISFTNKAELNLTEQAKGIYYLQLSTDNHTFVKKIVIK